MRQKTQRAMDGKTAQLRAAAEDVLAWADYMGGWDAPCWGLLAETVTACHEHTSEQKVSLEQRDTICGCNHWWAEHDVGGECGAPGCDCHSFVFDPAANTPEAIADRGGEHAAGCGCALCRMAPVTQMDQPTPAEF